MNFYYFAGAALHHFIELQVRFLVIISVYIILLLILRDHLLAIDGAAIRS